jgi:hypothetical protein
MFRPALTAARPALRRGLATAVPSGSANEFVAKRAEMRAHAVGESEDSPCFDAFRRGSTGELPFGLATGNIGFGGLSDRTLTRFRDDRPLAQDQVGVSRGTAERNLLTFPPFLVNNVCLRTAHVHSHSHGTPPLHPPMPRRSSAPLPVIYRRIH